MRLYFFCIVCLLLSCCAQPEKDSETLFSTIRYANSPFGNRLSELLDKIELGDLRAWQEFKRNGQDLDGEYSQTFSVACAEIVTRDPTFFLRRYLAGESDVVIYAARAYSWCGESGRRLLDEVYDRREAIATLPEAQLIKRFRRETNFAAEN